MAAHKFKDDPDGLDRNCQVCGCSYHCANCNDGSSMMGHYFGGKFTCVRTTVPGPLPPPDLSTRTCLPGKHHWHIRSGKPVNRQGSTMKETCCQCPRTRWTILVWESDWRWWKEIGSVIS